MANGKVLVVGGGAGGGDGFVGGGGAGGGVVYDALFPLPAGSYDVAVGLGGATETNGQDSSFSTITAIGGGHGAGNGRTPTTGGSGGAGSYPSGAGAAGTPGQGHAGGNGGLTQSNQACAGGAGGASEVGQTPTGYVVGGDGGDGIACDISGTTQYYGPGGGGAAYGPYVGDACQGGLGGLGGGGVGGTNKNGGVITPGTPGQVNKGTGGGGNCHASSANVGGSGIVIIRYPTADFGACTGGTITTIGLDTIHTFTSSGTFVVVEKSAAYKASGTAIFGPYVLPVMIADPASSSVDWTEDVPTGTSLVIKVAIVNTAPLEDNYQTVTNGGSIPGLTVLSSGKNLYFKAYLATTDTAVTPSLLSLGYQIVEEVDPTKVQITLTAAGRIKYPIGDVTVSYAKVDGNLVGDLGGQVDDFALSFAPININEVFNPHEIENISLSISQTSELIEVFYRDFSEQENISLTITQTSEIIHINDIPQ